MSLGNAISKFLMVITCMFLFIYTAYFYESARLKPTINTDVIEQTFQNYTVVKKMKGYSGYYLKLKPSNDKKTTIIKVQESLYNSYLVADTIK